MKKIFLILSLILITTFLCGQIVVSSKSFNDGVKFSFYAKESTTINLSIYNIKGQLVTTLLNNKKESFGSHEVIWYGTDKNNKKVRNGIYFYKVTNGKFTSSRKMILLK